MSKSLANLNFRLGGDIKDFQTKMRQAVGDLKKAGEQMKAVGKTMSVAVTAPLTGIAAASAVTFANFEQEMAKVQAISGATGQEFEGLKKNAQDLGASTRFAASEVAALQLNYSKLGFSASEIQAVTSATLDLALATGEDLARSAEVAASTLRGFGLNVNEMPVVVDVMAKSFSSSALNLEKFAIAMATVAPVAKNAGVSIQEATAMLSVLVDRGVEASTAGTGLRNIFLDVAQKGITVEEAFRKIMISANKNATALDLFGKRGATVATILAENATAASELTAAYNNAEGSSKKMAEIMDNTLQGSFLKVKSALEAVGISMGEVLAPVLNSLAEKIAGLLSWFNGLSEATKTTIAIVGGLAAAIGPVLVTMGFMATNVIPGLVAMVAKLKAAFVALRTVMLTNPYTALVAVLGLAATALITFAGNTKKAEEAQWKLGDAIKDVNEALGQQIWAAMGGFTAVQHLYGGQSGKTGQIDHLKPE